MQYNNKNTVRSKTTIIILCGFEDKRNCLYLARENLADSNPVIIPYKASNIIRILKNRMWNNHSVTVSRLFVCEMWRTIRSRDTITLLRIPRHTAIMNNPPVGVESDSALSHPFVAHWATVLDRYDNLFLLHGEFLWFHSEVVGEVETPEQLVLVFIPCSVTKYGTQELFYFLQLRVSWQQPESLGWCQVVMVFVHLARYRTVHVPRVSIMRGNDD